MAQCIAHDYWWQASVQKHLQSPVPRSKLGYSSFGVSPFFSRSWDEFLASPAPAADQDHSKLIVCFRESDDDPSMPEFADRELQDFGVRTNLHVRFSPWAVDMINGLKTCDEKRIKESTGGPCGGGGGRGDDGDGGDGGGEGDDEGGEYVFLLPVMTLAFAAFHLGYCIAVWVKDENLDVGFFRTGLGLFILLALAAIRLNSGAGLDAYILGLGASLGVMAWTGERCVVKKEGSPAGVVALFAASMAVMFTAALYHNI